MDAVRERLVLLHVLLHLLKHLQDLAGDADAEAVLSDLRILVPVARPAQVHFGSVNEPGVVARRFLLFRGLAVVRRRAVAA